MKQRIVEVLYFASCPHGQAAVDRVREVSEGAGVAVDLHVVQVESEEAAHRLRFLGSPSVRVDGRDVEGDVEGRTDYGLQCRVYADESGFHGVPPASWIRAALLAPSERPVGAG
ncbi:hypothetical protein WMF11_25040 [Sorangium sp. So ce295]|uniref:DF family (seleno)protein n=1 Tax=Sorangium sp. So ce295 TaxID=3133295 RepID=UPI003F635893